MILFLLTMFALFFLDFWDKLEMFDIKTQLKVGEKQIFKFTVKQGDRGVIIRASCIHCIDYKLHPTLFLIHICIKYIYTLLPRNYF